MRNIQAQVLFLVFLGLTATQVAQGQEDSSDSLWQYYPPLRSPITSANNGNHLDSPSRSPNTPVSRSTNSSANGEENFSGFTAHLDPLFNEEARPSWQAPIEDKPVFNRPIYDRPSYAPPMFQLEPIRKPVAERPMYILPNDNKPNNSMRYDQAPAEIAPTMAEQAYRGPNYVIKPYLAPTTVLPAFDRSNIEYDRPEYDAPVYNPPEYRPPRELPPDYLAPPEE